MSSIFSTENDLEKIAELLSNYVRLPVSTNTIPGNFMESVLAHVRRAKVLQTYDYIDVYKPESHIGWSVKSTKASTPLTWKRAKIPNKIEIMNRSKHSVDACQELGTTIINFCNEHAHASMCNYKLEKIGYARLLLHKDGEVEYFERLLCSRDHPDIFNPNDFEWHWSQAKATSAKEQLPALHGIYKPTGAKWWAWHGHGENQLHFSGEKNWWPDINSPHSIRFHFPHEQDKLSFEQLVDLLEKV